MYCVYKHTCPNEKIYIGITCNDVFDRWRKDGSGYKNQKLFYRAILKYGWDNIKHEILCEGLSKEEAEAKEIELIAKYKSNDPKYGYNLAPGGRSTKGYKAKEETKQKISNSLKGNQYAKGYHHTEETRKQISKSQIGHAVSEEVRRKISESNKGHEVSEETKRKIGLANTGKHHSDETKKKMSKMRSGSNNPRATPVCKFSLDGVLLDTRDTVKEFADELGLSCGSGITACCRGKTKTAYGFIWRYKQMIERR